MDFNSMLNKMNEAKKKFALVPSEREKECKHESGFRYTGSMPCTGPQKCMLCGMTEAEAEAEKRKKTAKESKVNEEIFKVGDKVKVSDGSGVASGKVATVVDKSKIKIDGRGIPTNVQGAYKPVDWSKEVAIEYEVGKFDTMYKNRLHKVDESKVNEKIPLDQQPQYDIASPKQMDAMRDVEKLINKHGLKEILYSLGAFIDLPEEFYDLVKKIKESKVNESEDIKWRSFGMRSPLDEYIISNAPRHRTKLAGYLDAIHVIRNNFVVYANLSEFGKYVRSALEIASVQLLNQYETGKRVKDDDELQHEIEKAEEELEAEEESEFDEGGWEEEQKRLRTEESIEPDFNEDGEEAQIKKLIESVRELIGEVPGINRKDQEILTWALDNGVISPEFPDDEVMINALVMLDMVGEEDVNVGSAEEDVGIQAYYLKYIMLPRAKKEYVERDLVDESIGEYGIRWRQGGVGRAVNKEKTFSTKKARDSYAEKLEKKDGFIEFVSWLDPKGEVDESKIEVPDSVETFSIVSPEMGDGCYWKLLVNGKTHIKCKSREECYIELAKYKPGAKESKVNEDGLADKAGKKPEDFDKNQLAAGTKVEMEHTDDKTKAQRIAMDHLTEDPKYYTKLRKMEAGACEEAIEPESDYYTVTTSIEARKDADDLAKKVDGVVIEDPKDQYRFKVIKKKGLK